MKKKVGNEVSKLRKVIGVINVKSDECLIDKNQLNLMADPHAMRYFHATSLLLQEIAKLFARWHVSVRRGKLFITLPEEEDGGIYL